MKKNKTIFWVATIIIILWEGVMPLGTLLFTPEYATVGTRPLGYPDYFAYALIICKVLGVFAIAFPKTPSKLKEWAYAGFFFLMSGALFTHLMSGSHAAEYFGPGLLLILTVTSWYLRPESRKIPLTVLN